MTDCQAGADTRGNGYLQCDLPAGRDGLHWDELMGVSWTEGRPDGQV